MKPAFFALLVVGVLGVVLFGMMGFAEVPWEFLSPTLLGIGAALTAATLWGLGYAFARGLEQTTPDRLTLAYFLVLTIVLPGAVLLEMCVLASLRVVGRPPYGLIMAMNIIPAFMAGWLFYTPFASHVTQLNRQQAASWRHFRRCFGLYLSALLLGLPIVAWARSPGFWLIGQLFLWPLCAVLGGIAADARQHRVWRQASVADA
jgi:hypothetical protein